MISQFQIFRLGNQKDGNYIFIYFFCLNLLKHNIWAKDLIHEKNLMSLRVLYVVFYNLFDFHLVLFDSLLFHFCKCLVEFLCLKIDFDAFFFQVVFHVFSSDFIAVNFVENYFIAK